MANNQKIDSLQDFKSTLKKNRELQKPANEAALKRMAEQNRPLEVRIIEYWHSQGGRPLRMKELVGRFGKSPAAIAESLRKAGFIRKRIYSSPETRPFSRVWLKPHMTKEI